MKNYILITLFSSVLLTISCKKKEILESTIVKVPTIALIGNPVFSTSAGGGTYSDPGAIVSDESAGQTINLSTPTETDIDLSTPGLYTAKYKYKTKYGFDLSASRLVLVTSVDPEEDLSGTYARASNGQEVNITKVGAGLYKTDNVGGVAGDDSFIYDVYFGLPDDSTLVLPAQITSKGEEIASEDAAIIRSGSDITLQWVVIGSAYGTALRKFIKQ